MKQKKENKKCNMFFIALLIIFAIVISDNVLSLGIGPSRQYINYNKGDEIQGEFLIINDEGNNFRAGIYAQGDLANIITFERQLIDVEAGQTVATVPYTIRFNNKGKQLSPGEHKLEVVVRQFPPESDGSTITANVAVIAQIIIKVPFPGKYAEAKFFISGTEDIDTPAKFVLMVYNFGTSQIVHCDATIEIFNPMNERVAVFDTDSIRIDSKEEAKIFADWMPDVERGTYTARATVHFDGKETIVSQDFDLGQFVIDISDVSVESFRLGDVAKFDILLTNNWNTDLQNVYVDVKIENQEGREMISFKTAMIDIGSHDTEQVEGYWYTEGVSPGLYTVKFFVHYAGKITSKELIFEVDTNSFTQIGTVGRSVSGDSGEFNMQGLLIFLIILVVILLIAMNIVWFYFLSKKMKK